MGGQIGAGSIRASGRARGKSQTGHHYRLRKRGNGWAMRLLSRMNALSQITAKSTGSKGRQCRSAMSCSAGRG